MGFCILGGKESYLRKTLSDLLTSLGQAVGIGATPAQFSTAINNIYTTRYTAGQDSLKVDRTLTLTASQTGTSVDITDNWYTKVNASAVYTAGQDVANQPSTGLAVFNIPTNTSGSTGISSASKTKKLPAGTYRLLIIMGEVSASLPTITLKYASTTRTYTGSYDHHDGGSYIYPSYGGGTMYGEGNPLNLYWQDSFTLSSAGNVTLQLSTTGSNYRTNSVIAIIY